MIADTLRRASRRGDWSAVLTAMGRVKKSWRGSGATVSLQRCWHPSWGPRPTEPGWILPIAAIYPLFDGSGWALLTTLGTGLRCDDPRIVNVTPGRPA